MSDPKDNEPIQRRLVDPRAMSFGEHLEELRKRLIWAIVSVAPIFVAALVFGEQILEFMTKPVYERLHALGLPATMQQTGLVELLGAWLKVSFVVTIVVGIPLILFQLWLFVAPGLYRHEQRFAKILLPMSVVLSVLGLAFLYFVMLPAMLTFLINFGSGLNRPDPGRSEPPAMVLPTVPMLDGDPPAPAPGAMWYNKKVDQLRINIAAEGAPPDLRGTPMTHLTGVEQKYRIAEYVSLIFTTSLAFIAGFQTPVVVLLLGWTGLVSRAVMAKKRRYAIFVAAAGAAILAPSPDPFSMIVLAIPLYLLYELGLFLLQVLPADRVARGFGSKKPTESASDEGPRESPRQPPSATTTREGPDAGDE
jgi:sec-independent protein translocase protein TatC